MYNLELQQNIALCSHPLNGLGYYGAVSHVWNTIKLFFSKVLEML